MPLGFGLVLDAALIGVILIVLTGEFPGWGPLIGCVLAVALVSGLVSHVLPGPASYLGIVAGAAVGTWLISWLTSTDLRRCAKAMAIYLGLRILFSLLFGGMFS